jgi:hypothetical protein
VKRSFMKIRAKDSWTVTMGARTAHCKGGGLPYTAWVKRPTSPA